MTVFKLKLLLTALFSCYMDGATWNCFRLGARSVYTMQPCTSLRCHFFRSHIHACVFSCNMPLAPLAEWPGCFTCYCGHKGVEPIRNKSKHIRLNIEKNILPPLLPVLEPETFRSRVRRSTTASSPLPYLRWHMTVSFRGVCSQGE